MPNPIILDKDHKHFQILSEHLIRSQQVRMETIKPDFIQLLILRLDWPEMLQNWPLMSLRKDWNRLGCNISIWVI